MAYENLIYEPRDHVALITLNRPHRLNALSNGLQRDLAAVVNEMRKDDNVHVAVITGAPRPDGRPCFCAGGDLKDRVAADPGGPEALGYNSWDDALVGLLAMAAQGRDRVLFRTVGMDAVATFEKPTIAAIDGVCTAGGLELAMSCDLRTAAVTAEISDRHMITLGALGGRGLQTRLPAIVGLAKAQELIWTSESIDGNEAHRIGLVNRVFPSNELMEGTMQLANRIASMRPRALQFSKMLTRSSISQGEFESLRLSLFAEALLKSSDQEHVAEVYGAWVEKRAPRMGR